MTTIKWLCNPSSMLSCGSVRAIVPAAHINCSPHFRVDVKSTNELYYCDFPGTNILVLQRLPGTEMFKGIVRDCRWKKMKVIYDIDDAFWFLPESKDDPLSKAFGGLFFPADVKQGMLALMNNEVDLVTCSTEELKKSILEHAPMANVEVVENGVDGQFFYPAKHKLSKVDGKFHIAWYAANGHNHNGTILVEALKEVMEAIPNVVFHIIGVATGFSSLEPLKEYGNRVEMHNWVKYIELGTLINRFDVVTCPINETEFTVCKSELKAVESSMCGVVPVMSDVPQYRRFCERVLEDNEKALLCKTKDDWVKVLMGLATKEIVVNTKSLSERTEGVYGISHMVKKMMKIYSSLHNG